jgi:hypothetical protein
MAAIAPCARLASSCQQLIEFRKRIAFAVSIRDDDLPAFAGPDSGLGDDDKRTRSLDYYTSLQRD